MGRAHGHDVASAMKPVLSILLFIALQEGLIESVDEPVVKYEPRLAEPLGFEDTYTFNAFGPDVRPGRLALPALADLGAAALGLMWPQSPTLQSLRLAVSAGLSSFVPSLVYFAAALLERVVGEGGRDQGTAVPDGRFQYSRAFSRPPS